jgi:hypothetical protein
MPPAAPAALGGLLALLFAWLSLRLLGKRRLLNDIPTSKADGVFIGFVELKGKAETASPLRSFLAERDCVWYAWSVEEHWSRTVQETYRDADGKTKTRTKVESGWRTVADGGEQIRFFLADETGAVRVDPAGAKIEPVSVYSETCRRGDPLYYGKGPTDAVSDSTHERRFQEQAIPVGARLYVVGQARERDDVVAPEIGLGGPLFIISTRSEQQVTKGWLWGSWALGILGGGLAVGGLAVAAHAAPVDPAAFAVPPLAYLAAWGLGWSWMAYNSLVNLRQRVRQAGSLVDVELKRRHDLIPNLVRAVEGLRDHERTVQTEVAHLREQLAATPPGQPGPDPHGVLADVRSVVERYPELKAQASFLKLQEELAETEERIALARAYYNDIATFYATRLEQLPDRFVAPLAGLRPAPLLTAAEFERVPPKVDLAPEKPRPISA